jgi:Ca-activated chloride channel family protein
MSTHTETQPTVSLSADNNLIPFGENSVRGIVVNIKSPLSDETKSPELELNLCLAIDRSGSMGGERIQNAEIAAIEIVKSMSYRDALSIVVFSDESECIYTCHSMDANARRKAESCITAVSTRGTTNLSDGWLCASEQVARLEDELPPKSNRVLVLTDGKANCGITSKGELGKLGGELSDRGIVTSCVGIGTDYSTLQIHAIAEFGGGALHNVEVPEEIAEVVLGEFQDSRATVAENVVVRVRSPWPSPRAFGHYRCEVDYNSLTCHVGSIRSGQERLLAVQLNASAAESLTGHEVSVDVSWTPVDKSAERRSVSQRVHFEPTNDYGRMDANYAPKVCRTFAAAWQSHIIFEALELNGERRYREARGFLEDEAEQLRKYVDRISDGEDLLDEISRLLDRIGRRLHEGMRKNAVLHHKRNLKGTADHRTTKPKWDDILRDPVSGEIDRGKRFSMVDCEGHIVVSSNGRNILLDTGSPITFSQERFVQLKDRHPVKYREFQGVDCDIISGFIGSPIEAVVGMDVLTGLNVSIDAGRREVTIDGRQPLGSDFSGDLEYLMGVPIVKIKVDGRDVRMIVDTAAKLSYLDSSILDRHSHAGTETDFYPGIGEFSTETYHVPVGLGKRDQIMTFGKLPGLLSILLDSFKADGILGFELYEKGTVFLSFKENRLYWTISEG